MQKPPSGGFCFWYAQGFLRLDFKIKRIYIIKMSRIVEKLHRGVNFSWDEAKANANPGAHDGVTFDEALDVFFDPFMQLIEASRNHELRHRAIGYSKLERLLVVVHLEETENGFRIISAWKASGAERKLYEE